MTYLQTLPKYGLKLDFRPKFPFWGGLGRIHAFPHWVRSHSLNSLVYQRVLAAASRTFLKTALRLCRSFADHFPISGHCRIGLLARLCWRSRDDVMKNLRDSVSGTQYPAAGCKSACDALHCGA